MHILVTGGAGFIGSALCRHLATADYPTKARRPLNSRLCSDKFATMFGWRSPAWKSSMEAVVRRLIRERPVAGAA